MSLPPLPFFDPSKLSDVDIERLMQSYAKLAVREALERAAVRAWSTGMDVHAASGTLGLCPARDTGSKCADAIRAIIKEYE